MNRKFDDLGRISIPKEMRKKIGLGEPGSEAKCEVKGDKIIISNPKTYDLNEYLEQQKEKYKNDEIVEITRNTIVEEFNKIIEFVDKNL